MGSPTPGPEAAWLGGLPGTGPTGQEQWPGPASLGGRQLGPRTLCQGWGSSGALQGSGAFLALCLPLSLPILWMVAMITEPILQGGCEGPMGD